MRILNHLSLKLKLFILLLLLSIIPIYLVSNSSEYFMLRAGTSYSASISGQYTQFVSKEMSGYIQSLDQAFDNVFTNQAFQKYVRTSPDALSEQAGYLIQFRPIVRNSLQFHPEVLGALYLDRTDKVYFESYQKRLNEDFSFAGNPFYEALRDIKTPRLLPSHPLSYIANTKDSVFSYVRPITDVNTGEALAWFVIEIREEKLTSMLSGNKTEAGGRLTLYHNATGDAVSTEPVDTAVLRDFHRSLTDRPQTGQPFLFASGGIDYEGNAAGLLSNEWKLIWTAPLTPIKEGVTQTYYLTLLIAALSLGVALITAFPVMNRILKPLYSLNRGMQHLGRGQYVPIPITERSDEVGSLVLSYNQTIVKLQNLEREVFQTKMKEKEREVLQLQAQINPHFLFNTLETIESYAVRNNGEAVGDMVQSVSRMMRYTVRNDNGWTTLKEEMDYIRNFMKIHHYRNGTDVQATFDIDPAALQLPVMKLSIQPYIENAFKYGWSPSMTAEEFALRVQVVLVQETEQPPGLPYMRVTIHNTGMAMTPEVLEKLHRLMERKGEADDPFFRQHTGIFNAYRRFILVYGEQAYFRIDSAPGAGTVVAFHLPLMRETS